MSFINTSKKQGSIWSSYRHLMFRNIIHPDKIRTSGKEVGDGLSYVDIISDPEGLMDIHRYRQKARMIRW